MTPRTGTHLSAWPSGRAVPAGALALRTLQELRMFANTVARLPGRVLPESSLRRSRAPVAQCDALTCSATPAPGGDLGYSWFALGLAALCIRL